MSPESQPGIQLPVWFSKFSACACGKTGKHHFCRLRTVTIVYGIQILLAKCLVHATDIEPHCPSPQYIFVVLFLDWRNTCYELLGFPSVDRCYFGLCSSFRSTMEMAMADTYKSTAANSCVPIGSYFHTFPQHTVDNSQFKRDGEPRLQQVSQVVHQHLRL